ncbi:DUF3267 domain-containing protein [Litchfieldia salsa]|uniref:Putative zincin peptidase n=1 Tax=Litchfieldia salsa TaxID=930152 RepID=A0A1H0UWI3_9BACI|nr:DUF3267 domain-containing protein [Litchfieldia salsa]SDP70288.1 Putative zincin peptidase [Litchfieldia salsa]
MTCWKTINLSREYGFHRIVIVSFLTMLMTFILLYLPLNLVYSNIPLTEDGLVLFVLTLLVIFPIHKLLHSFPLIILRKQVKITIERTIFMLPVISVRPKCLLSKPLIMLVLITPFVSVTGFMLYGCALFPQYIHYFTIIIAVHLGICVSDFILLKQLFKAPRACIVEEIDNGYDVLINN